jgi:hypothetical protein
MPISVPRDRYNHMRQRLPSFAILGLALFACSKLTSASVFTSSSLQDAQIGEGKKAEIDGVAIGFVKTFIGPKAGDAYDSFTEEGKINVSRKNIEALATKMYGSFAPQNLTVQHTYLVHITGEAPKSVICATDLTKPDGWVALATTNVPEQAHVLLLADLRNNKIAFEVWLIPVQNKWMVQAVSVNTATLADLDCVKLLGMAREQHAKPGHEFNSFMLCAAAQATSNRGANLQLSITDAISDEMAQISIPVGLRGPPPFIWHDGNETFKVVKIGPLAIAGKLNVIMAHEVTPWQKDSEAEAENRKLLSYFKRQYPDYKDVFSGLIIQAKERDGTRLFGTIEKTDPMN